MLKINLEILRTTKKMLREKVTRTQFIQKVRLPVLIRNSCSLVFPTYKRTYIMYTRYIY